MSRFQGNLDVAGLDTAIPAVAAPIHPERPSSNARPIRARCADFRDALKGRLSSAALGAMTHSLLQLVIIPGFTFAVMLVTSRTRQ
jgi:hypothetical protein